MQILIYSYAQSTINKFIIFKIMMDKLAKIKQVVEDIKSITIQ